MQLYLLIQFGYPIYGSHYWEHNANKGKNNTLFVETLKNHTLSGGTSLDHIWKYRPCPPPRHLPQENEKPREAMDFTYRHQDSFHFSNCFRRLIVSKRTQHQRANNSSNGVILHTKFPRWTAHILCWGYHKLLQVNSLACFLQVFRKKFFNVWVWINSYKGCSFRIKMEVFSRTDPYFQNIAFQFFQSIAEINKNLVFQGRKYSFRRLRKVGFQFGKKLFVEICRHCDPYDYQEKDYC